MNTQKLKWIVPGVVVGVGVFWWGISAYASSKAEDRLRQALAEYGLQHRVHWKDLSASVFGTVTLKDVTVDLERDGALKAERVKVSDLIDDRDRQRINLQVEGLSEAGDQASSFLLGKTVGLPTGRANLPPMDASVKLDARYDDDEAEVAVVLRQKDALDAEYRMRVTQIGALRDLARAANSGGANELSALGMGGMGIFGALSSLSRISLASLEAKVEDRGMVERGITLYKRHNVPLQVDGGSARSQRNKAFEQSIETWQADCQRNGVALLTQSPEKSCRAAARFLSGDKRTLHLTVSPKTPVSVEQLTKVLFGRPSPAAASLLNAELGS